MSTAPPPAPPYSSGITTPGHPSEAICAYSEALCGSRPPSVSASRCSRVPHSRRAKSRIASTNARCSSDRFCIFIGTRLHSGDADPRRGGADGDAGACAAIYAPYVTDTAISLEEVAPTAAEMAARIERTSKTHPWLVAEEAGEVTGYAYGSQHRERAAYRWATDVAVYVDPRHQRRGVGRTLYETLFGLLAQQGFRMACAGVTLPNEASVGLHEALGFQPVGVYRRIGFKFGAWRDVGWWQLELANLAGGPPREPGPPVRLNG